MCDAPLRIVPHEAQGLRLDLRKLSGQELPRSAEERGSQAGSLNGLSANLITTANSSLLQRPDVIQYSVYCKTKPSIN